MSAQRGSDINLIMASHDKRFKETSGLLSRLWRITLGQLEITPVKWNTLLVTYLDGIINEQVMSQDRITNERNNLRKGLAEPDMTFEMLTRGLTILNPRAMTFEVELLFEDRATVFGSIDMLGPDIDGLGKLTYLYRNLLSVMGKDIANLEKEIDIYLSNTLVREEVKGRQRGNDKGNLRRELPGDNITWEVFKKGLRVLAPKETIIRVKLRWNRSKVTTHYLIIPTPKRA